MPTLFYYLGISTLFTHELDAVMRTEWRLLYILKDMSDQSAYPIFVALHVPAFFLFFWLGHHPIHRVQSTFRLIAAAFLVVHAGVHFYNANSPQNYFEGPLSNILIYAAAVCGLVYIVLVWREYAQNSAQ